MEYGILTEEKIDVGLKIISPLLKKVHDDLIWWRDQLEQNKEDYNSEHDHE